MILTCSCLMVSPPLPIIRPALPAGMIISCIEPACPLVDSWPLDTMSSISALALLEVKFTKRGGWSMMEQKTNLAGIQVIVHTIVTYYRQCKKLQLTPTACQPWTAAEFWTDNALGSFCAPKSRWMMRFAWLCSSHGSLRDQVASSFQKRQKIS